MSIATRRPWACACPCAAAALSASAKTGTLGTVKIASSCAKAGVSSRRTATSAKVNCLVMACPICPVRPGLAVRRAAVN